MFETKALGDVGARQGGKIKHRQAVHCRRLTDRQWTRGQAAGAGEHGQPRRAQHTDAADCAHRIAGGEQDAVDAGAEHGAVDECACLTLQQAIGDLDDDRIDCVVRQRIEQGDQHALDRLRRSQVGGREAGVDKIEHTRGASVDEVAGVARRAGASDLGRPDAPTTADQAPDQLVADSVLPAFIDVPSTAITGG